MRKQIFLIMAGAMLAYNTNAQMTLLNSFSNSTDAKVIDLLLSGKKYCIDDYANKQVRLYNLNMTLWKTINVPVITGLNWEGTSQYVSENLFTLDGKVALEAAYNTTGETICVVFNEVGTILNTIDSSDNFTVYNIGTDSFVAITYKSNSIQSQVFSLPGTIPCATCSNGYGLGLPIHSGNSTEMESIDAIPNPATGETKIHYSLPENIVLGTIVLCSQDGKIISSYKVNSGSSYITINTTNLSSGIYYYSLRASGTIPLTKKLVVEK